MGRLYLVKRNEDVIDYLKKLAPPKKTSLRTAVFLGIGALSKIEFGYYNPISKGYSKLQINEQIELTSMIGNITLSKGQKKNKQTNADSLPCNYCKERWNSSRRACLPSKGKPVC